MNTLHPDTRIPHQILRMARELLPLVEWRDPHYCAQRAHSIYARWGLRSLIVAKFIPGLDGVTPPLAGSRVPVDSHSLRVTLSVTAPGIPARPSCPSSKLNRSTIATCSAGSPPQPNSRGRTGERGNYLVLFFFRCVNQCACRGCLTEDRHFECLGSRGRPRRMEEGGFPCHRASEYLKRSNGALRNKGH
jgi:hypothetical protein